MVTVKLQGGLGNQMFQIAAAYNLALKNNNSAKFNFNLCHTPLQGNTSTKYRDNIFKEFEHNENFNIKYLHNEKKFSYENIEFRDDLLLIGFFQSEKYFIENKETIIDKFLIGIKSNLDKNNKVLSFIDEIKDGNNLPIVSLHVRRGDYLQFKDIHSPCSLEYYKNCLNFLKKRIGEFKLIMVSDDKFWCKKNLEGIISPFEDELEDLILMINSNHNIIANSTFSWWGAYLNKNKNKIVLAPKKWFGVNGHSDQNDIIPDNWVKL